MSYALNLLVYEPVLKQAGFTPVGRSVNLYVKATETEQGFAARIFVHEDGRFTAYGQDGREVGRGESEWELIALLENPQVG